MLVRVIILAKYKRVKARIIADNVNNMGICITLFKFVKLMTEKFNV
jgi:hypothetical protein